MKFDITAYAHHKNALPIIISGFRIDKAAHGIYSLNFKSKNHKYLNIHTTQWMSGQSRIITLESHDELDFYSKKELAGLSESNQFQTAESRLEIYLYWEDCDEKEAFDRGDCIVQPLKWEYSVHFVPQSLLIPKESIETYNPRQLMKSLWSKQLAPANLKKNFAPKKK